MIREKIRKNLDKIIKVVSILCFAAILFAVFVSIQYARKRTQGEIVKKETYFNDIYKHFNRDWSKNKLWDHYTEHYQYMVNKTFDGKQAKNSAVHVYVLRKQKFNDELSVRTFDESRPDTFDVMNLNIFSTTQGDSSSFMLGEYFLRMNPLVLHKMSMSYENKNEGIVFKSYKNNQSVIKLNYDSYRDGEGIGEKVFDKDVLFEDQLCYTLRSLNFAEGLSFHAQVLESQVASSVGKFAVSNATFVVNRDNSLSEGGWKVTVTFDSGKVLEYTFGSAFPNLFYRLKRTDGKTVETIDLIEFKHEAGRY